MRFTLNILRLAVPLVLVTTLSFGQRAQIGPTHLSEPHHQAQLPTPVDSYPFRYWDKGFLITYAADDTSPNKPAVVLYDSGGKVAREAIVSFSDAESTAINDAAVSRSGRIVVVGGTMDHKGAIANFIAEIDDSGRVGRVVRTTPFLPVYVCAADDGTIWSYGFDRDENGEGVEGSAVLRQYSFDRGQLRAMLNKFSLKSDWSLSRGRYPGEITLRCNSKKAVLYNGATSELAEFDFATSVLKVAKINPLPPPKEMRILGSALTESGDLFVSLHDRTSKPPRSGLFQLKFDDSGVGSWAPVENSVGPYLNGGPIERLLGADGGDLVYTHDTSGTTYWSRYK